MILIIICITLSLFGAKALNEQSRQQINNTKTTSDDVVSTTPPNDTTTEQSTMDITHNKNIGSSSGKTTAAHDIMSTTEQPIMDVTQKPTSSSSGNWMLNDQNTTVPYNGDVTKRPSLIVMAMILNAFIFI
ncbi:uncharacterized protein LOC129928605 isoform X1 [Biomphalaria glabrata]|uniref:Uncharacterized protein LOC129928605 isoform X1 n=1 Tax=Biomphalaria glabrata TaxID=6526 RepID=A0A9W3BIW0_BIOGL|nr:uncharacterized protein LOC129928605 isoform X1 [Biomphalaria glabrata]